ncbi:hypothetical protein Nisw_06655 [Candidatus Nitrosopumilus sp. SW]|uniref:hypothetical protein n=1 Tax=Candidatus Nitrosopumilus sp. SW TaxID=2508726 RepID=UPI0011546523|nr:hypothetical protein [Candidatus Nitrosopumilus sp. SW]QDI89225.1 hypothetical protein Nisw_06655 [Candidatus Nitrosopumilus sp. SW]
MKNKIPAKTSNSKKDITKKIKNLKEKYRKQLQIVKDEIKKAEQQRISFEGLDTISPSSITSIQMRRERSILKAKQAITISLNLQKEIKKLELQYSKTIQ